MPIRPSASVATPNAARARLRWRNRRRADGASRGSDQLLGAQAVQGLVAKRLQAQAEPVEHRTVLGIGLAPLLERQALLGAGMAGLQQRHPLRRFVEDAFSPSLAHSASTW